MFNSIRVVLGRPKKKKKEAFQLGLYSNHKVKILNCFPAPGILINLTFGPDSKRQDIADLAPGQRSDGRGRRTPGPVWPPFRRGNTLAVLVYAAALGSATPGCGVRLFLDMGGERTLPAMLLDLPYEYW